VVDQAVGDVVEGDGVTLDSRATEAADVDADLLQEVAGDGQELRVDRHDRRLVTTHVVEHLDELVLHLGAGRDRQQTGVFLTNLDTVGRPVVGTGRVLQRRDQVGQLNAGDRIIGFAARAWYIARVFGGDVADRRRQELRLLKDQVLDRVDL